MKNKRYESRRQTPWDDTANITITQKFIKEKYNENYKFKHPKLIDTNEQKLFNSINIECCPRCGSINFIKRGFTKNKIQRYYCNDCERYFSPSTETIFENHKISITEWIEFLLDLFNYGSTNLTSKVNKNCINTSSFWLQKTFLVLDGYQDNIILKGDVYIDEFFYKVVKSEIQTKNGKQLRGLSINQFCIGLGYDGINILAIVEGKSKTSINKTEKTFLNHIEPHSKIIHDEEKSHKTIVEKLELVDEKYNSKDLKNLCDKENPLNPINHVCDLLRKFLNTHSSFDRKNLQSYLNLFCFMCNGHLTNLEKVDELLNLALTKKVCLKYREMFGNQGDKGIL